MQEAPGSAGDVDKAGGPFAWPVPKKKELALPDYRRKNCGCEIGDEGIERTVDDPLRLCIQPVPPGCVVDAFEGLTCCGQLLDYLGNLLVTDGKSQMVRDRPGCSFRTGAVRLSEQGERPRRGNIANDPGTAAG